MIDRLSTANPREDFRFLAQAVSGNQGRDRLADHLIGGIAEDALRAAIP